MLLGGLLTFAMRFSFIYLFGRIEVPETLRRALRFVPPAVLTAIVAPELLMAQGSIHVGVDNARLVAGVLAVLVAAWSRNALLTIAAGMAALLLLTALA
jgi:branched-subunit amino acid transport protein